ncbi:MAG: response regulator [Planctomycetes bacterium]|nr:response regulator [Planctomycetota bacterium]MBI3843311.1 response regulator [Planctomycetota bacterium]
MIQTQKSNKRAKVPWETDVLVVEDDSDIREAIRDVLLMRGYFVRAVSNGKDAIEHLKRMHYDVVVSDIRLPEESGFAVAEWAARDEKPPRVILITAYPEWYEAANSMKTFATLRKPFGLQTLANWVADAATRE